MSIPSPADPRLSGLVPYLSRQTLDAASSCREAFLAAQPFRHVLMDSFFEETFAERLLAQFPAFDPALAKNEIYGGVWGKAANPKIRAIAPVYRELYELIASRAFLEFMGKISGIPGLVFDPAMFGGGTHENLNGQDLDPHVDFNYDEAQQLHRRLNLIVYLNKDWQIEWGGALELHSNPRNPQENHCEAFNPIFNRAVLFETNERSWHGFPRIELPPGERHRSRKSVSIYLYTRERPAEDIAPPHGTFYVQRPLPEWVRPGHALTEEDCRYLLHAVDRRDKWIETYQKIELAKSAQLVEHAAYLKEVLAHARAPLTGYVMQEGAAEGFYPDGWAQPRMALRIRPLQPVTALRVRGWRPDQAPAPATITARLNGRVAAQSSVRHGVFEVDLSAPEFPASETMLLEITCDPPYLPQSDTRALAFVLMEIRAGHDRV
jgi:hypothetical protein